MITNAKEEATEIYQPPKLDVFEYVGQRVESDVLTPSLVSQMAKAEFEDLSVAQEPQDAMDSRKRVRTLALLKQLISNSRTHHWRGQQRYATAETIPAPGNVPNLLLPVDASDVVGPGKSATTGEGQTAVRPRIDSEISRAMEKLMPHITHGLNHIGDKRRLFVVQMLDGDEEYDPQQHAEFLAEQKLTPENVERDAKSYQHTKSVHAESLRLAEITALAKRLEPEVEQIRAEVQPYKNKLDEIKRENGSKSDLDYMRRLRAAESEFHAVNDPYTVKHSELEKLKEKIGKSTRTLRSRSINVFNDGSSLPAPQNFALHELPRDPNAIHIPL